MKTLRIIVAVAVLARLASFVLPWWGIVIGAGIAGAWLARNGVQAFAGGLFGIAFLWGVYALAAATGDGAILTERMAVLTGLPGATGLILVTSLVGAVLGALASWTGWQGRRLLAGTL